MKKAILFVIDDTMKILIGTTVKTIKLEDVWKPDNEAFIDRLFKDFDVITVESMSPLTKEDMYSSLEALSSGTEKNRPEEMPAPKAGSVKSTAIKRTVPQPVEKQKPKGNGAWFRSNTETTIILDDIDTGEKSLFRGIEIPVKAIIQGGCAINLQSFDREQVLKSNALKKLIKDGDIVSCTEDEARLLKKQYFEKKSNRVRDFGTVNGRYIESDADQDRVSKNAELLELGNGRGDDTQASEFEVDTGPYNIKDDVIKMGSDEPVDMEEILKGT